MAEDSEVPDTLEQRLANHAKAFESLMALTPAREYFGSQIADGLDPSEQWSRKKQTKEQKRAAKKAKLDPANQKSALDVMKERELKRKRELGMDDEAEGDDEESEPAESGAKRQKVEHDEEAKRRAKAEKRKDKRTAKKEKINKKKAKVEAKKAAKQDHDLDELQAEKQSMRMEADDATDDEDEGSEGEVAAVTEHMDVDVFDASGLADAEEEEQDEQQAPAADEDGEDAGEEDGDISEPSSAPSSPAVDSPAFDIDTNRSSASSSSSILPPSIPEAPQEAPRSKQIPAKPALDTSASAESLGKRTDPPSGISSPKIQLPDIDQAELQERLRQRIDALRAQRKADGPDGKPAKSRQELLDQRRKKEEQRKAAKKEQRRKAKDDEQQKREEQLRGSGSPMSVDMFSPRTQENNFSFSRLAFEDGAAADPSLTTLTDAKRKKGPQDPRTALEAAQKKQSRVAGFDAEKRADIADKDMWLNAKKRAHGERIRDDTSLLKKALKRKEKAKGKSEQQWQEREEAVVKGKEMKQKKREANLAKRKDEKGGGGKKKGGQKDGQKGGQKGGAKKKGRPGFEGRFKA